MFNSLLTSLLLSFSISSRCLLVSAAPSNSSATNSSAAQSTIVATATLNGKYDVTGEVQFVLQPATNAVEVMLHVAGLMALNASATYAYHIHTNPISSDGNCSSALGHLDPLNLTDAIVCSPQMSQYCQIGDLSGRNGKLSGNQTVAEVNYTDNYLRFWPEPFSLLGRSVVVHMPNSTRIACGNITSTVDGTADSQGRPTFNSSTYVTEYPTHAGPTPTTKYEPFIGTTPQPAVISQMIFPNPLPNVQTAPNVVLGTNVTKQMMNNTTVNVTLPAAIPVPTQFTYTEGASLPKQPDSGSNTTIRNSDKARNGASGSSSGVNKIQADVLLLSAAAIGGVAFALL